MRKKKLVLSPNMRKQYLVTNNLLGEWGSRQITVMSERLFLNSKRIKMSCEEGGFQAFLTQPLLVNQFAIRFNGYPLRALRS